MVTQGQKHCEGYFMPAVLTVVASREVSLCGERPGGWSSVQKRKDGKWLQAGDSH